MLKKTVPVALFVLATAGVNAEIVEQILVKVNGEIFTKTDLEQRQVAALRQKVQQNEVMSKIGITEDEARKYYDSHLSEFTTPPTVTLREILVSVPADARGVNVGAEEAAKEKAEQIRTRVTTGAEAFDKVAADA